MIVIFAYLLKLWPFERKWCLINIILFWSIDLIQSQKLFNLYLFVSFSFQLLVYVYIYFPILSMIVNFAYLLKLWPFERKWYLINIILFWSIDLIQSQKLFNLYLFVSFSFQLLVYVYIYFPILSMIVNFAFLLKLWQFERKWCLINIILFWSIDLIQSQKLFNLSIRLLFFSVIGLCLYIFSYPFYDSQFCILVKVVTVWAEVVFD